MNPHDPAQHPSTHRLSEKSDANDPWSPEDEQWRDFQVTPRYLAGSSGIGDPGFEPVAHWPHHYLDDGPCQLVVTSPDHRIRIGWFGDDYDLWKIAAYEDAVSTPRWTATFNHNTPPEIVAGLTAALAHDYEDGNDHFLAEPSMYWADSAQPLTDAGWSQGAAQLGTVEILAPDRQAGALIDKRHYGTDDVTWTLWAGPPGWGSRGETTFTTRTPSHLIAATAAAMADPAPVIRTRHQVHHAVEHLVRLTPVQPPTPTRSPTPTPLDVRRTAVTAAVTRAAHDQHTDRRVRAAQARTTTTSPRSGAGNATPPGTVGPAAAHTAPRPGR
jgi:Domain of unknown function (DUF317)